MRHTPRTLLLFVSSCFAQRRCPSGAKTPLDGVAKANVKFKSGVARAEARDSSQRCTGGGWKQDGKSCVHPPFCGGVTAWAESRSMQTERVDTLQSTSRKKDTYTDTAVHTTRSSHTLRVNPTQPYSLKDYPCLGRKVWAFPSHEIAHAVTSDMGVMFAWFSLAGFRSSLTR